jgi:hypothetical protein
MGWRLWLAAILLLLWPVLAQAKRCEQGWDSQLAITELNGKPVIAFSPWYRWQAALGNSALQFDYAQGPRPNGPQDWVIAACLDPKLSANGRESVRRTALFGTAGNLYYGLDAHYTRPDGKLLREGFLWGRAYPPGSQQSDGSSVVNGEYDQQFWMAETAILDSTPVFAYVTDAAAQPRSGAVLRVYTATAVQLSANNKWREDDIDHAVSIGSIALAQAGDTIFACYEAQQSTAAGNNGLVLQQGRRQADGTLSWRVLRVLHPGLTAIGGIKVLAGSNLVYIVESMEEGLVLASCPVGELQTKATWDAGIIPGESYPDIADALLLDDLPVVLFTQNTSACILAMATVPMPQWPQDWSYVRFPTGSYTQGALAVIDGTLAIAYQCETPRGIAFAWTDKAQPRQAADWHTSLVFREADFKGITTPAYSSMPADDGTARLALPEQGQLATVTLPPPSPWRAEAPAPPGSEDRRNTRLMLIAILAILLCAGITAFIMRKVLRSRKMS